MRLVAASVGLIAVHGQALAWMLYLPSEPIHSAVIEIAIRSQHRHLFNNCYQDWAASLGVKYWRISSETSACPAANGKHGTQRLANPLHLLNECNVTIDAAKLVDVVQQAQRWTYGNAFP